MSIPEWLSETGFWIELVSSLITIGAFLRVKKWLPKLHAALIKDLQKLHAALRYRLIFIVLGGWALVFFGSFMATGWNPPPGLQAFWVLSGLGMQWFTLYVCWSLE